jgi:hypothetical protein
MTTDLFTWLDALWTKATPEGTPPIFMLHRFLASDRRFATAAMYLQADQRRSPDVVFHTWKGLLPKHRGAPRLAYVAPKKPPAAEALTVRMMQVLGESRVVVEEMQALVALAGKETVLYEYFGVEPPTAEETVAVKTLPKADGLLAGLE